MGELAARRGWVRLRGPAPPECASLHSSWGDTPQRVARQDVVSAILRGTTFVTAYLRDGKWKKGEDVRVVTVHGVRLIRTDNNSTKADNLGALPEYA
jgi:hypothetical protein